MTACGWASSEWRRPMSSAAPTSAECVCTRGGRSAGAAVGNHDDAATPLDLDSERLASDFLMGQVAAHANDPPGSYPTPDPRSR